MKMTRVRSASEPKVFLYCPLFQRAFRSRERRRNRIGFVLEMTLAFAGDENCGMKRALACWAKLGRAHHVYAEWL